MFTYAGSPSLVFSGRSAVVNVFLVSFLAGGERMRVGMGAAGVGVGGSSVGVASFRYTLLF